MLSPARSPLCSRRTRWGSPCHCSCLMLLWSDRSRMLTRILPARCWTSLCRYARLRVCSARKTSTRCGACTRWKSTARVRSVWGFLCPPRCRFPCTDRWAVSSCRIGCSCTPGPWCNWPVCSFRCTNDPTADAWPSCAQTSSSEGSRHRLTPAGSCWRTWRSRITMTGCSWWFAVK